MTANYRVVDVTGATLDAAPRCGVKDQDHPGFRQKTKWLKSHLERGMKAKVRSEPEVQG